MSLSWKRIKPKQEHFLPYYCAVFLVTGVLGFWGMWLQHRSMIWKIDGIGQYYPSFLYIGKYLRELIRGILRGEWKLPLYDLSIGFGEDIIGTLNYYGFGDPLNLLAVFATVRNGAYWFTAMYFLRAWLTGAAFGYYATGMGYKGRYAALGGVAYTFCGFALVGCAGYSQWYSWLMLLPLLLAGCEQVFRHHSAGAFLLTFSAFYGACCGFYFLYNTGLVLALYCVVRQLHIQGIRRSHVAFWECLRCLFYYSLGLLLAGPVFFPAMLAFFDSENADYSVWRVIQRANNYIPFFNKSFWKSLLIPFYVSKSQTTGISFFELLAIPVLFSQPKSKRKSQLSIALILCIAAMHFRIVGYLFNAFNEYNKRYVFAVHFTLAMVLVDALQYWFDVRRGNQRRISAGKFRFAVVAIAVIVSISGNIWKLFPQRMQNGANSF